MCSSRSALIGAAALCVAVATTAVQAQPYPGIGRAPTPQELAAWDIDVRPDWKGLPAGSGSVAAGEKLWDARCALCHGAFGESNQFFHPLVGGTSDADIGTGRVARLTDAGYPARTTLMKLSALSSLWDYIHRAMPWQQPKSLSPDDVYAVTAYLLNMGGIVGDDFVLSDRNIAEVQQRLPNRNGMTREHSLWPGAARKPDVQARACMSGCGAEPEIASSIPDFARGSHGNLAEQQRPIGAQRGADTSRPAAEAAAR